jgi:rubrerythrin
MGREHAAMEQYTALAESAEPGPIKDLFIYLANEETKHKTELEKVYYETIHSGGV